jgi:hypothetical protein
VQNQNQKITQLPLWISFKFKTQSKSLKNTLRRNLKTPKPSRNPLKSVILSKRTKNLDQIDHLHLKRPSSPKLLYRKIGLPSMVKPASRSVA